MYSLGGSLLIWIQAESTPSKSADPFRSTSQRGLQSVLLEGLCEAVYTVGEHCRPVRTARESELGVAAASSFSIR